MSDNKPKVSPGVVLGPLSTDLPFMIRNIYALLRPVGAQIREPLGIETGSIGILSLVWINPGISQNDLAASLAMKKSAIALQVRQLEDDGLLERRRDSGDRRVNAITLTSEGHQMVARIRKLTDTLNAQIMDGISDDDREAFFRVLSNLHDRLMD